MSPSEIPHPFHSLQPPEGCRPARILVLLGDQLDPGYLDFADFDSTRDLVVMMEVAEEARHVPSHKARTAIFLSAMRHFALELRGREVPLAYSRLDDGENRGSFAAELRKREDLLLDADGKPEGGQWNFDKDNRKPLKQSSPPLPPISRFTPDAITREVLDLVERFFPEAPGRLDSFAWPVTRKQALEALQDFLDRRLPFFGDYQDAMQRGEPWLFHSLLSPALNLKLLDPREAIDGAIARYRGGSAPLNAVEGFVRQIIGWREFIRGVYWHEGPEYGHRNGLEQRAPLPEMYWSGETEMVCMRESLGQVLEHGYGHHIQRLMITGNYALLAGVSPQEISDWYLGMYVDGIDWVTLPNTLGMMMHADGGVVGTKPYVASGRYVQRMSDYCNSCRFDPGARTGESACSFTTLYWDSLMRQQPRLGSNRRMAFAWRNLERLDPEERDTIQKQAEGLKASFKQTSRTTDSS